MPVTKSSKGKLPLVLVAPENYLVVHEKAQQLIGRFSGRLLIVGGARCVWDDLAGVGFQDTDILCINDIVMHFPGKVKHFFSNDSTFTPRWLLSRRRNLRKAYGPVEYVHTCNKGAEYNWPWDGQGTSALGAVFSGLAMGYDKIILCGVPLDDTGNYFDPPWVKSDFMNNIGLTGSTSIKCWGKAMREVFNGKVTSCSGRTRELLGLPS